MKGIQILRHTGGKCKYHLLWILKEGREMLYDPLWLGLTRKG